MNTHKELAEMWLHRAKECSQRDDANQLIAIAQVHATLATVPEDSWPKDES